MTRLKTVYLILFVCFCYGFSLGDVIHFKDGRKIEGVVISQDSKKVKFKTKYGTKEFLLSEIKDIEIKKTKEQEYEELLKQTDLTDVEAVLKLVNWCNQNKLESKSKKHLRDLIKLDPENDTAREMLGYVKYEGKWYTPRELKAFQEKEEREKKIKAGFVEYKGEWLPKEDVEQLKAGKVKYKDKWVTPIEKERLEKNLILYEGQWISKEDVEKLKQGLFNVGGDWVNKEEADRVHSDWEDPWILKSTHIKLTTNKNYDYAQQILGEGEGIYKLINKLIQVEPLLDESLLNLYVCSTLEEYNNLGNAIGDERSSNYSVFFLEDSPEEGPLSVTYSVGDKEDDIRYTKGLVRHAIVEQYLRRIDEKGELPDWFIKGQAAKLERFFVKEYISWSLKSLRRVGGFIKTSQYFDSFAYTEQEIYQAGLLCAYLDSNKVSERVKSSYQKALKAIVDKKKISSEFAALEKSLTKDEKNIRAYMNSF